MGYIQNLTIFVDTLSTQFTCTRIQSHYQNVVNEVREQVRNVIQYIFLGQTHGRLNPLLIDPVKLEYFINNESALSSRILSQFPNLLNQSGIASLIEANFDELQFTFLLSYPQFGNSPIWPYLQVSQTGFTASVESDVNTTECLMLNLPKFAVIHGSGLYIQTRP